MFEISALRALGPAVFACLILGLTAYGIFAIFKGGSADPLSGVRRRYANAIAAGAGASLAIAYAFATILPGSHGLSAIVAEAGQTPAFDQVTRFFASAPGTGLDLVGMTSSQAISAGAFAIAFLAMRDAISILRHRGPTHLPMLWLSTGFEMLAFFTLGPVLILGLGPAYTLFAVSALFVGAIATVGRLAFVD